MAVSWWIVAFCTVQCINVNRRNAIFTIAMHSHSVTSPLGSYVVHLVSVH